MLWCETSIVLQFAVSRVNFRAVLMRLPRAQLNANSIVVYRSSNSYIGESSEDGKGERGCEEMLG